MAATAVQKAAGAPCKAISELIDEKIEHAKRVGKHSSDAAEEFMDDTQERIKRHPVESMTMAFAIGVLVGGFISWLSRHK